jgi:hypothetical protein
VRWDGGLWWPKLEPCPKVYQCYLGNHGKQFNDLYCGWHPKPVGRRVEHWCSKSEPSSKMKHLLVLYLKFPLQPR